MRLLSFVLELIFPRTSDATLAASANPELLHALLDTKRIPATDPPTATLLPFKHPTVAALVRSAKYRGDTRAQALLGAMLSEYLETALPGAVIVPIPLSPRRVRERGFNQCERIAREALRERRDARFSLETGLLSRTSETEHQARLGRRARLANLHGAFSSRTLDPAISYVVLDDVITTGTTMREAIAALRRAGAVHLYPVALAYA